MTRQLVSACLFLVLSALARAQSVAPTPVAVRGRALVVGVNRYSVLKSLRQSVKDANDVARGLAGLGYQVELVTDDTPLRPVTPTDILGRLTALAEATAPEDVLVLYFSGHGFSISAGGKAVDFVCPAAADPSVAGSSLALLDVRAVLKGSRVRARHKVVMIDACRTTEGHLRGHVQQEAWRQDGIAVLYSTTPGAVSIELAGAVRDQDGKPVQNGVFSHFLIRALGAAGDVDGDGTLLFKEVGRFVTTRMLDFSFANADLFQMAFFDRALTEQTIPLARVARAAAAPRDEWEACVADALQQPPEEVTRFVLDRVLRDQVYRQPAVQAAVDRALRGALAAQMEPADSGGGAQELLLALVDTVLQLEGAVPRVLPALAVGVEEPERLEPRLRTLARIATDKRVVGRDDVAQILERLLPPFVRRATDVRRFDAVAFLFDRAGFPRLEAARKELQLALDRAEQMQWTETADELLRQFGRQGLRAPVRTVWTRFEQGLAGLRWDELADTVRELGSSQPAAAMQQKIVAWLEAQLVQSEQRPARVAGVVARLAGLETQLPGLKTQLLAPVRAYVTACLEQATSVTAAVDALAGLPALAALDAAGQGALLQAALPRLRELALAALPAPGSAASADAAVVLLEQLARLVPELAPELAGRFLARAQQVGAAGTVSAGRIRELELMCRFGGSFDQALDLMFPSALLATPAASVEAVRAAAVALRTLAERVSRVEVLGKPMAWVVDGAVLLADHGALTDVVLAPNLGSLALPLAGEALTRRVAAAPDLVVVAFVLRALQSCEPARRAGSLPPLVAPAVLGPAVLRLCADPIAEPAPVEAIVLAAQALDVLAREERLVAFAALVGASAADAPELPVRIARVLGERGPDEFPAAAAARVFQFLCAQGDWDGALPWAVAAQARGANPELVEQARRVVAFRDQLKAWVGKSMAVVKHARYLRGPWSRFTDVPLRLQLRVDAVDGFVFRGTADSGRNRPRIAVTGRIGDQTLELESAPARQSAYRFQRTLLKVDRSVLGMVTLAGSDTRPGEEADVRWRLFPPTGDCVVLDCLEANLDFRGGERGDWPTQDGGKPLLLPLLPRQNRNPVTWMLGDLCADGPRTLVGTLRIDESAKNLQRWRTSQGRLKGNALSNRARIEVQVDQGPPVVIQMDLGSTAVAVSVPIPKGARSLSISAEGAWPEGGPILECFRLVR